MGSEMCIRDRPEAGVNDPFAALGYSSPPENGAQCKADCGAGCGTEDCGPGGEGDSAKRWEVNLRIPHPALRAAFSRWEKDILQGYPSPSGRGWPEAPGEGFCWHKDHV